MRCWYKGLVETYYYTSEFLGHATAQDLTDDLKKTIDEFGASNLVQLSMDGPNVNLKCKDLVQDYCTANGATRNLLDIGTCGLHTCHNAFRAGLQDAGWGIEDFLSDAYTLLKDCPARRADYKKFGETENYPLKFVKHRLV